jgi:hypothetical protein
MMDVTTSTYYDGPEQESLTFEKLKKTADKLRPIVENSKWNDFQMASKIGCAVHTNLLTGNI